MQNQLMPAAWANREQLLLCSRSPREVEPENPLVHGLPRNIAGSALATEYCNTPLYTAQTLAADALERLLALEPNAENLKRWQALQSEPRRKLEIEDRCLGGFEPWLCDANGGYFSVGPVFDSPYAVADWCEHNGFAWEVIGLVGDPLVELAAWRAGNSRGA